MKYLPVLFTAFLMMACVSDPHAQGKVQSSSYTVEPSALAADNKNDLETATFASGCFWCTEAVFEQVRGVESVVSGYAGGEKPNPTYEEVSAGRTNYAESVQIYYDPEVVSYKELLEIFFGTHDPTQVNRQGPDIGKQYRSEVFYANQQQEGEAKSYMKKLTELGKFKKPIATKLSALKNFYEAEGYHQNYYEHNPGNPYIISVTKPKVEKFKKKYASFLKEGIS